ncbi:hypothetical protein [Hymenobacter jeollabukensis]|uniref:Uncharacterized protein n=1 Tax=Hymenobacter jeollabukensis TaxID=2025313 RepID=A0A5R8WRD0_9BACT|nr:hypothetical protein [Hymenobacter jeollabukensis]TLM93013.1 hypothetical protein FDY95_10270 [Hymenobacter jeollabukensis]
MPILAALLLEGVYLARELDFVLKAGAVLGVGLAAWLAYKGWGRLRRAERRADGTLHRGATLGRWAGGVALVLPAVLLVIVPVYEFFSAHRGQQAYQAALLNRHRLFAADYELDTLASPPAMRRYAFDLSLRPDSTFVLRSSVPHDPPYLTGRWRVENMSLADAAYDLRLEPASGNVMRLYTLDVNGASWLERTAWPISEAICLRKRLPASKGKPAPPACANPATELNKRRNTGWRQEP